MPNSCSTNRASSARRGMLLAGVLVCLALLMTLSAVWLRTIALERALVRGQQDDLQMEYLAQAGLERAKAQLAAAADYAGETWRPAAAAWGQRGEAAVEIRVEPAGKPETRRVRATARLSTAGVARAQCSREAQIEIKSQGAVTP